jgi:hypothetical protein
VAVPFRSSTLLAVQAWVHNLLLGGPNANAHGR